jgi:hypothetical protein
MLDLREAICSLHERGFTAREIVARLENRVTLRQVNQVIDEEYNYA